MMISKPKQRYFAYLFVCLTLAAVLGIARALLYWSLTSGKGNLLLIYFIPLLKPELSLPFMVRGQSEFAFRMLGIAVLLLGTMFWCASAYFGIVLIIEACSRAVRGSMKR